MNHNRLLYPVCRSCFSVTAGGDREGGTETKAISIYLYASRQEKYRGLKFCDFQPQGQTGPPAVIFTHRAKIHPGGKK